MAFTTIPSLSTARGIAPYPSQRTVVGLVLGGARVVLAEDKDRRERVDAVPAHARGRGHVSVT
eukprot:3831450-Rhodomonas_salina.2